MQGIKYDNRDCFFEKTYYCVYKILRDVLPDIVWSKNWV